jgi:hypothetical protein
MRETAGSYRGALHIIAGVMAISTLLPLLVHPPRTRDTRTNRNISRLRPKKSYEPLATLE